MMNEVRTSPLPTGEWVLSIWEDGRETSRETFFNQRRCEERAALVRSMIADYEAGDVAFSATTMHLAAQQAVSAQPDADSHTQTMSALRALGMDSHTDADYRRMAEFIRRKQAKEQEEE